MSEDLSPLIPYRRCSLYGVSQILRTLARHPDGMNVSQLERETKLGSRTRVKKYLELMIGMGAVEMTIGDLGGPIWWMVYKITDDGREWLRLTSKFSMLRTKISFSEMIKKKGVVKSGRPN